MGTLNVHWVRKVVVWCANCSTFGRPNMICGRWRSLTINFSGSLGYSVTVVECFLAIDYELNVERGRGNKLASLVLELSRIILLVTSDNGFSSK